MQSHQHSDWHDWEAGYDPGHSFSDMNLASAHAGHGRRWASFIGVAALFVLGCWVALTSVYIILHDDLLANAIKNRLLMQTAYEDRIADLRGEVGAVTGRLMLNQDEFDGKVERLNTRQALLEERQTSIASLLNDVDQVVLALVEPEITGSMNPRSAVAGHSDSNLPEEPLDASTGDNTIHLAFASQFAAQTVSRQGYDILVPTDLPTSPQNRADRDLMRLASAQYKLESDQFNTLNQIEHSTNAASIFITEAITNLGFQPQETVREEANSQEDSAVGGPLVQVSPHLLPAMSSFERQLQRIHAQTEIANNLYHSLIAFPIGRPLPDLSGVTSRFGLRTDPFRHTRAHHGGIDYRAATGVPVRATAAGTVIMARRNAGYGKMVEISHANGLTTRYAHMSRISVRRGQKVNAGDLVGRVGSTGRSTGPHLHYETRRSGTAVNPQRFLDVGAEIYRQTSATN